MIIWKGYTTGGSLFRTEEASSASELLENLIDENILIPYWEFGSPVAEKLAEKDSEFQEVYNTFDSQQIKRFDYDALYKRLSEADIFEAILNDQDQAYKQEIFIDNELTYSVGGDDDE